MPARLEVYLTRSDEVSLVRVLQQRFNVVLLRVLCFSEDERVVASLDQLGKYPTDSQIALTVPEFQDSQVVDVFPEGHRRLHTMDSSVIEFNRGFLLTPQRLKPGRIVYYPVGRKSQKSKDFRDWANRVFSCIVAELKHSATPIDSYLGGEVYELVERGELELSIW